MTDKKIPPRKIKPAAAATEHLTTKDTGDTTLPATGAARKRKAAPPRKKVAESVLISDLKTIELAVNQEGKPTAPFIENVIDSPDEFFARFDPAPKLEKSITHFTGPDGEQQKLKIPVTNKNAGGYIVPVMKGSKRLKGAHVAEQQVFPFDFDEQLPGTMHKVQKAMLALGWGYVIYTTASHNTPMKARPDIKGERFRLVLVAKEPVSNTGENSGDAILCRRAIMTKIEDALRQMDPDAEDLVVDPHTYTPKQRMYMPVHGSHVQRHNGPAIDGKELVRWGRERGITVHFKASRPGAVVDPKVAGLFAPVIKLLARLGAVEHGAGRYLLQASSSHADGYTTESKDDDFAFMLPEAGVADVFNISAIHGSDQEKLDEFNATLKGSAVRKAWFEYCCHAVCEEVEDAEDLVHALNECCRLHRNEWDEAKEAKAADLSFDDDDEVPARKKAPPRRLKPEESDAAEGELLPNTQKSLERLEKALRRQSLKKNAAGLPFVNGYVDLAGVKLGVWSEEVMKEKGLDLAIKASGEVAELVDEAIGKWLASHHETKRAEHAGLFAYDGKIWHPFTTINQALIAESRRQGVPASVNWALATTDTLRLGLDNRLGEPLEGAVPFENGVLLTQGDDAGKMVPHQPDMWLRSTNGITWEDEQPTPVFDAWLDFLVDGRDTMRQAVLAMFWHVLTGDTGLKAFYEITGESNTGKSVVSNLCVLLAGGVDNVLPMDMETLSDMNGAGRFALAELPGKRLILMSEQSSGRFKTARLKMMTGGDAVRVEIKGGGAFSWVNRAPIIVTNNQAMVFKEDNANQAIVNRRVLIGVNRVVPAAKRDTELLFKLEKELGGIAFRLLRDFDRPTAALALANWKDDSDDLVRVTRELDLDFAFADMLEVVEPYIRERKGSATGKVLSGVKHSWRVGVRPKDDDLRTGTVDAAPEVGLYPLYVHYRKMNGEAVGTLSNRKFAATMLNHLKTIHRKDGLPAAVFERVANIDHARLWWKPGSALLDMLTQSTAASESLDFE